MLPIIEDTTLVLFQGDSITDAGRSRANRTGLAESGKRAMKPTISPVSWNTRYAHAKFPGNIINPQRLV